MFVYLSKKIAIPNSTILKCIAWDKENGYLACGGDDGLLKILRLDSSTANPNPQQIQANSNLSANQTLEGHNGSVSLAVWNETNQKLTTSDENGLIIVWVLFKGTWNEEMINNRNKSVVTGMAWNSDGQKICIVYEDGAIIVGSVEGNRLWGRDIKNIQLSKVEWSPDSKIILFATANGEVHLYDSVGSFLSKLELKVGDCSIIGLKWFKNSNTVEVPSLAIVFSNGKLQLMKNERDENPLLIDIGMEPRDCQWNHNGSILAIVGRTTPSSPGPNQNAIHFYSPNGNLIRAMKLPGNQVSGLAWEGFSLRLAFAIDSYIYLAQVKHDYMWTSFSNTLVYHFNKKEKSESYVMFWDTKNNERYVKQVRQLVAVTSSGDHCVLVSRLDDEEIQGNAQCRFGLILCNALGTPVDSKYIHLEPRFVAMTASHVITASEGSFILWHYRTPRSQTALEITGFKRENKDKVYDLTNYLTSPNSAVCSLAARDNVLVFGTQSGHVVGFDLPSVNHVGNAQLPFKPIRLALNSNATKLACLDPEGVLHVLQIEHEGSLFTFGSQLKFERRDVWDICWASDNSELFALMEKTRMYIFRSLEPEEPIVCSAYLCQFKDLEILAVALGEILKDPENPSRDHLVSMETKSLRDTRHLLEKVGTKEAHLFVEENSHPRLWRLLAESALQTYDLAAAESAFVRCADFAALQLLHRLKSLPPESLLLKAEVAAYFHRFDEAEKIFLENDRRDLALALRRKLGDWSRVAELQKSNASTDIENTSAYNQMGNYYCDRHQYQEACYYYRLARNNAKLAECCYNMEDYESLEELAESIDQMDPLVVKIASMFTAVGLCQQAVQCYMKCNQIKAAIDTCITLHQWNTALDLSKKIHFPEIATRLKAHADRLLECGKISDTIELFRKANCYREAANLLYQVGELGIKKWNEPLKMKKIFVLAAILTEEGRNHAAASALMTNQRVSKYLETPWRPAEAWHYYLLVQQQLQQGHIIPAMATAFKLQDYEDILDREAIFSTLALTAALNKCFGTCSKAFTRLESLPGLTASERENYSQLALEIFSKYAPKDGRFGHSECSYCTQAIPDWVNQCTHCNNRFASCVATGRPLLDTSLLWSCRLCKHSAIEHDIVNRNTCPLCHSTL